MYYRRLLVDVSIILILALLLILIVQLEYRRIVTAPAIPPEWSVQYDPDPGVPAYQLVD